jgi:hypothetical protein
VHAVGDGDQGCAHDGGFDIDEVETDQNAEVPPISIAQVFVNEDDLRNGSDIQPPSRQIGTVRIRGLFGPILIFYILYSHDFLVELLWWIHSARITQRLIVFRHGHNIWLQLITVLKSQSPAYSQILNARRSE